MPDSPLEHEEQLFFIGHELLPAANHHTHTSSSRWPGGKCLLTPPFPSFFPISKANSTSDLHMNLQNWSLFHLLGRHSFLKTNMVENPAVKNLKDLKYQSNFLVNELSVSIIPPTPRWSLHLSNSTTLSPETTTHSLCLI